MVTYRSLCLAWLAIALLALPAMVSNAQPVSPSAPSTALTPAPQPGVSVVSAEAIATRKAAVQARLEGLGQLPLPQPELEATRAMLEQHLKVLAALEEALQKQATLLAQVQTLEQDTQRLRTERQALTTRPPRRFPDATEPMREAHETQLQAVQEDLDQWLKQQTTGESRLARIATDLEQRTRTREQLEKELLAAQNEAARATEQQSLRQARVELLELRLQLHQVEQDALAAEHAWLSKRGPLVDAHVALAQARQAVLQQELAEITQTLGRSMVQEQAQLARTTERIKQELERTSDPVPALALRLELETMQLQEVTAEYRQEHHRLSEQVLAQEQRLAQEKRDTERLAHLVQQHTGGERVAQRLRLAFEQLRRERIRHRAERSKALEASLLQLSEQQLELGDRLYSFDILVTARTAALSTALASATEAQRTAALARINTAFETQKVALRDQQQALAALTQETSTLLALYRERKRLLDDSYRFVLAEMFWLRDGRAMSWTVFQDAIAGTFDVARRWQDFGRLQSSRLRDQFLHTVSFWLFGLVMFLALPWGAHRLRQYLWSRINAYIAADTERDTLGYKTVAAGVMVLRSTIWPLYIVILLWLWTWLLPSPALYTELEQALVGGAQVGVLVLWVGLLGRAIFRPNGWGQTYWNLPPALCRFMHRTLLVGWVGTLLFLVPRHVLLSAPGGPETAAQSLALARLCFTAFQVMLLVLLGVVGRRGSPLMQAILANSRQQRAILWRNWPLLYGLMLGGIVAALTLDLLGYRYAVRALWRSSGESVLVILLLTLFYNLVNAFVERLSRQRQLDAGQLPASESTGHALDRGKQVVQLALILIGILTIFHLYGIDQNLFSTLDSVRLLEVGKGEEGQVLWLTLRHLLSALTIFAASILILRNLPSLYAVVLYPRVQWDQGFRYAFLTLSRYLLFLVATWWALTILHFQWSSIQWILAAISVGLGFGLQEIVGNFVSGLILLMERPVSVGDLVTVDNQVGRVTRITIRATTIQNVNNQTVIIPNKSFITRDVINWTLGDTKIRVIVPVGVAYGSDLDLVERLLREVVHNHPKILKDPPPDVFFTAFGESSLDWNIRFVVPSPQDRLQTTHDLLRQIHKVFAEHRVEIPFPQRDLHVRSIDPAVELLGVSNGDSLAEARPQPAAATVPAPTPPRTRRS